MIKLNKPNYSLNDIIDKCISNMNPGQRKTNILMSKDNIIKKSEEYDELAENAELSKILEHNIVPGGATKEDMRALYEQKFVPEGQGGNYYYEALMLLAPHEKCPYCGQRTVKTLDHYLPKSKYPTYAVTPYNLVPSCSDCNLGKLAASHSIEEEQSIHPYYDDFTDEVWIMAKLIEEEPIAFAFYAGEPQSWDDKKIERVKNHFKEFKLDEVYKSYSGEEYIACENRVKKIYIKGGKDPAIEYLEECIEDKMDIRKNTWQAAMYKAIINSDWYWDNYIKTKIPII